ncbi:MAG: rRNA maturation RNase YbeY [Gemmatimonadetes bacterium]|nr:rRNA maturation RNase YbeY [Gemmatimonadota bacterium]
MPALQVATDGLGEPPGQERLERVERAARAALACQLNPETGGEHPLDSVVVTLVGPARMQEVNRQFHGVDAPTDVLAFRLDGPEATIGDVYVCPDIASGAPSPLTEELMRLAIHGVLHARGLAHPETARSRWTSEMFRLQEAVLAGVVL